MLTNQNILLAISGGIAAYKCAELTRRLKERGANVRVVMTTAAKAFITPLTMQAVSGNPVSDDLLDPAAEAAMGHIELAKWADLIVVAPASADVIARITAGMANDLLTTVILASAAPLAIAPAMNQQMYHAAATTANLATLAKRQVKIWGPAQGEQACGDIGPGRMLQPMELVDCIEQHFTKTASTPASDSLKALTITITAGPTREALDPVRFISNHSSGKMGYAIAQAAASMGATVNLISGKVNLKTPECISVTDVDSALQMHQAALALAPKSDIFIACAAVADYRPADIASEKIKKSADTMTITMVKNPDIVADVAGLSTNRPFTVGFAAETQNVEAYATGKMQRKKLDMICANNVATTGQGFNADDNALSVFWPEGESVKCHELPLADKTALAQSLIALIAVRYRNQQNQPSNSSKNQRSDS
ncbi:MAG: phosphopantothenoylcysteine decarboxylase/phosphopantothenate--cysteine ligase [Phenylobacterium sp.]